MGVFEAIGADTQDEAVLGHDPASGLETIIAIRSTAPGPALGGTRFLAYPPPGSLGMRPSTHTWDT